jgi:5-(carboxyamino)imidazole ribonucleotide mutase
MKSPAHTKNSKPERADAAGKTRKTSKLRARKGGIGGENPAVGIVMGSKSDLSVMKKAAEVLLELEVACEVRIVSAHRTPLRMMEYGQTAATRGIRVVIAGAGGAAHLPGMIASVCPLPVVGVPVKSSQSLDGWDSVLSILQMPAGIPVATVALNGARNAGLLAAQILALSDAALAERLAAYRSRLQLQVESDARLLEQEGWEGFSA